MASDEDTAAGLMAWLNSLDVVDNDVQTVSDLSDGTVIWKALRTSLLPPVSTLANHPQSA
jgi:hypothetical protein